MASGSLKSSRLKNPCNRFVSEKGQTIFAELLQAKLFEGLGPWRSVDFRGAVTPKLLRFQAVREEGEEVLFLATIISSSQKETRQSFQDLLEYSVQGAAQGLQGIFGLEVISADLSGGIRNFSARDFGTLLVNHGRKLELGGKTLIRYGQVFSVLHKRAPADWGKIDVEDHIEIINPETVRLASILKKMTRAGAAASPATCLVHDLGPDPVWSLEEEFREKRFADFLQKNPAVTYFYRTSLGIIHIASEYKRKCGSFISKALPVLILAGMTAVGPLFANGENLPQAPKIFRNGKPGRVTVQDLSGLGARPFRLLVNRNNQALGDGFARVYALGVREGDELEMPLETGLPGTRATVYRISDEKDGRLHVRMPFSKYFPEPGEDRYAERVGAVEEEFWVVVFEKTDSPDEKNIQVRYFEEDVRQLVITSFKTNLTLSSLKLKMKDFADEDGGKFVRDAQLLVDRLHAPQRILVIRLWLET